MTSAAASTGTCWLLEVSDAAATGHPAPPSAAIRRGRGLGLYVVTDVCDAHGWDTDGHRKIVWVRIDCTRTDIRTAARQWTAWPRSHQEPNH
jgi:hypothetical protein